MPSLPIGSAEPIRDPERKSSKMKSTLETRIQHAIFSALDTWYAEEPEDREKTVITMEIDTRDPDAWHVYAVLPEDPKNA